VNRWKVAGINFDHMHMGDNLRMVAEHPAAEIVGLCDERPERVTETARWLGVPEERLFCDFRECLESAAPDIVLLCPATAEHALWVEKVAPYGPHILMEKPFAASLEDADRMIRAAGNAGKRLAINWPMVWYPCHQTAKRLIDEGRIGTVIEFHYYGGNRGPLWHGAGKRDVDAESATRAKKESWFYKKDRGGGSLLDYLGYGATLGTWFLGGRLPLEVMAAAHVPVGLEVDEQSVTVVRYEEGLSTLETRWGTFSDPWTHQPQPKCGFVLVGTEGTISSYDFEPSVRVQTSASPEGTDIPVDRIDHPFRNPVEYLIDCIEQDRPVEGPLSPQTSRVGQQIVDAAFRSTHTKRTERIDREDGPRGRA
jgi:glucose-fructose oxidoreductase